MMKKQLNITTLRKEQLTRKGNHRGQKKNKENKKQKTATKSVPEENSEEEDDAELKIKVQQQKCALHSFYVLMHRYREKIPQRTWDLLAQTTFWDTIDVFKNEKLTETQVKKHELDFELIMKHYNKEKNKFIFGEIEAEITVDDVYSLFHISTEGEVVDLKNKPPRNKWPDSKYFEKGRISKDNIKRPQLETELSAELNKPKKNQDAEKIASLILMYLLAVFFFSRSGTHLDWELIIICENLEEINKYNWSKMMLDFLKDGTVILADSGVEVCIGYLPCIKGGAFRDYAWGAALLSHFHFYFQKKNQKHIGGCMVALMVYLFEHFSSLRDEFFRDRDGLPKFLPDTLPSVYPLCAGWAAHIKDVLQNRRNRSPVDYEALTSENNEVIWNPYERLPDNFFPKSIRVDRQMRLYRGPLVHPIHNRVIIYHRPDCCPRHFGVQRVIADHCPPVKGYVKSTRAPSLKEISKLIGAYKSWQQSLVELPIDDDNDSSVAENVLQPSGE
ncbi:hypothetical protein ACLB2K_029427 [Fragaria x ananassa]